MIEALKKCIICHRLKSLSQFYRNCDAKDGHSSQCAECAKLASKKYRIANRERLKTYHKEWRKNNPERHKQGLKRNSIRRKNAVFKAYGGYVCNCCGETEPMFLTIDHVNNDGAEHRHNRGYRGNFYAWIIRNNYPKGFQVLCYNCNRGKYLNKGVCPHKAHREEQK